MSAKPAIEDIRADALLSDTPDIPGTCRRVREALGLTIPEYAKAVEINARYLGDIERGHRNNPTLRVINRIVSPASMQLGFVRIPGKDPSPGLVGSHDIPGTCRKVREALKLTIPEYAKAVGLYPRYLGDIERGHRENPTIGVINRIAAAGGIQLGFVPREEPAAQAKPAKTEKDTA